MLATTLAAYRDDGLSTLLSLVCSSDSTLRLSEGFPPRGFVGLVSSSSVGIGLDSYRLKSIQLRRRVCTHDAHLWRLTLEWETSPLPSLHLPSGLGSVGSGES